MTQENKRMPEVGDRVRTTRGVGPFDKGSLLAIFEIISSDIDTSRRTYRVVDGAGRTCVMRRDSFEVVEEWESRDSFAVIEEESRKGELVTREDFEERVRKIYKQREELTCELSELADKLIWMEEYGYGEYDETRYRVWRLIKTSKDEIGVSRTLVDSIADLVRK